MLFLMLGLVCNVAWGQAGIRAEKGSILSHEDLMALTEPTDIVIQNISGTNRWYFCGNKNLQTFETNSEAWFVWEPAGEGEFYLKKKFPTEAQGEGYLQKNAPSAIGAKETAQKFTAVYKYPTDAPASGTDANLVRFVRADNTGTWINCQTTSGTPVYNSGSGAFTMHNVYRLDVIDPLALPKLTTDENNPIWYSVVNTRSNKYMAYAGDAKQMTQEAAADISSIFYFTADDSEVLEGFTAIKVHTYLTGKLMANNDSWTEEGITWYLHEDICTKIDGVAAPKGLHITKNQDLSAEFNGLNDGESGTRIVLYDSNDVGSIFFMKKNASSIADLVAAYIESHKAAAIAEIEKLARITAVYPAAAKYIDQINGITAASNAAADVNAASAGIDEIVLNYKKSIDGKAVTFQNNGSGDRNGRYLGYDKKNSRAAAIKCDDDADEAIWTFKVGDDGMFKLYNFVNDLYLGDPNSAATHAAEKDAPSFRFEVSTNNAYPSTFVLVCSNDKWLHVENGNNYKLMHYKSQTDGASLWTIKDLGAVRVTRDDYNAKKNVLNDLISYVKRLQDEFGLVKSGEKVRVVVNHPSGGDNQPSSNLLDGNNATFVHSSYDNGTMNTVENHYIEVELSAATQNVFCYLSKRNNNNRPAIIKVYAGNSAEEINTEVATLNMNECYDNNVQSYFSKGINLEAAYTHLRFVVTATNTDTKYFTLSEFYVLPVNDNTMPISNLTSASITDVDFNTKVTAAQSYLERIPATEEEISAAQEALSKTGVGYPKANSTVRTALSKAIETKHMSAIATALNNFKNSTDIQLPEPGKAYKMAFKPKSGDLIHITASGTSLSTGTEGSVFYCVQGPSADYPYVFVSAEGNFLSYKVGNDGTIEDALTTAYTSEVNDVKVGAMVGVNSNVDDNTIDLRFGTVYVKTNKRPGSSNDDDGCFVYKTKSDDIRYDGAKEPYYKSDYTSAIVMTEVEDYDIYADANAAVKNAILDWVASDVTANQDKLGEDFGRAYYVVDSKKVYDVVAVKNAIKAAATFDEVNAIKNSFKYNIPVAGTAYYLLDSQGTYLDIHNLGTEPGHDAYNKLATMSATAQEVYITGDETDGTWKIHTTAEGGDYLHQSPIEPYRRWDSWVGDGGSDFKWIVETVAVNGVTHYRLKHNSGNNNGYLGSDNHAAEQPLYVDQGAGPALKFRVIDADVDNIDAAVTANSQMAIYGLQRSLGFVQNAGTGIVGDGQFTCNYPASTSQESGNTYANLIDGKSNTYFHSGYGDSFGDGSKHYLQVSLNKLVKTFRFYYKKRQGTNNNRPTDILIEGSVNGEDFEEVTAITSGLPTDENITDYYSEAICMDKAYKYLRFTVRNTNTNTNNSDFFFTFAEFYVLPNTPKVEATFNAVRSYRAASVITKNITDAIVEAYDWNKGMPIVGEDHYLFADTKQSNGTYVARYLYNNNGSLATNTVLDAKNNKYVWTVAQPEGTTYYTLQNKGDNTKYISYGNSGNGLWVGATAVQLDIQTNHAENSGSVGIKRIGDDNNGKFMVTKADGSSFNRNGDKINDGSWCSDYLFIPADVFEGVYTLTINGTADATATFNGETKALPATFYVTEEIAEENATVVITSNDPVQAHTGFTDGSTTVETLKVTSLTEDKTYTANFGINLVEGGKYYIYAYTQPSSGNFVNRYLYKDSQGAVKTSTELIEMLNNYIWTVTKVDGKYKLTNAAGGELKYNVSSRLYLGTEGDNFAVSNVSVQPGKVSIVHGDNWYISTKANGTEFNHYTNKQVNATDWTTDYCFVPVVEPEDVYLINFLTNSSPLAGATVTWNGVTKALPASFTINKETAPEDATATITVGNAAYAFTGVTLYGADENLGAEFELVPTEHSFYQVTYDLDIFSANYGEKWVRLQNCSDEAYYANVENVTNEGKGKTAKLDYSDEKQLWCLVGNAGSFVLYNKAAGESLALNVPLADNANYGNGSEAKLTADKGTWKLKEQSFGYALVPTQKTNNSEWGINMYANAGGYLKLYGTGTSNTGSYWVIEKADIDHPLTFNVEVDQVWASSPRVAELTFTVNGKASQTRIEGPVEGKKMYLPAGANYEVSSMTYRGYTYEGYDEVDGVLTASYTANEERTLYYSRRDGHPYRIPAIATAPNGDIFAICDYRPCGADIGNGDVDIVVRISKDNGETWGEEFKIADGDGGSTNRMETGYGDPAIVADRESDKLLVMMVAGRTTCWSGRWESSKEGDPNASAVNRVARVYGTYDVTSGEWQWTAPVEMTDHIYSLFMDGTTPTVTSMFIGSGKICQSRVVKKGQYYRLYCALWTRDGGNRVIYSDDFGGTWNVLGTINDRPASGGDEPKCEELPDGTVVLSSRKSGGRYFNLFTFNNEGKSEDEKYTTGSWGTVATSTSAYDGSNQGTNGEIYKVKAIRKADGKICDVMLQSIPAGPGRANVKVYYKEMDYTTPYTPATFAADWKVGKHVSTKGSAYSTMILQADGRLGFFFEEEPSDYCMVYIPYTIEDVTDNKYSLYTVNSTISEYGVGTFYASEAMQIPEGVKAYVTNELKKEGETGVLTLTELEGIIPAKTGALIFGEKADYEFIPSISYGTAVENNMLVGFEAGDNEAESTKEVTLSDDYTTYVLAVKNEKAGFYRKDTDFVVANNKAYLNIPKEQASNVLRIRFGKQEGTTEIETSEIKAQESELIYDLMGRPVEKMEKGIYIVNGKKVVVK